MNEMNANDPEKDKMNDLDKMSFDPKSGGAVG